MDAVGLREPNASEREFGWAGQTEVYRCGACATVTDFPRHNNPSCLLTTRSGRCGEWANAFCLVCRSLSLDARYVLDWTDHVWVEVWLPSQRRFVHLDACEQAFDTPLMYEAGWGKKLTHILSFSRYGVMDASPRYTRRFSEVVMRRAQEYALEGDVRKIVSAKDAELVSAFRVRNVAGRSNLDHAMQLSNLSIGKSFYDKLYADTGDVDISSVSERRRLCGREMQGMQFLGEGETKLEKLRGRCSGDKAWRLARGELGSRYSSIS
jgi:peptide-N4-(N-acetyl-beta-glucosaminyl)asparagine amidase